MVKAPTKSKKEEEEDRREEARRKAEERTKQALAAKDDDDDDDDQGSRRGRGQLTSKDSITGSAPSDPKTGVRQAPDIPPQERTALYRDPTGTTLMDPPGPGPIDPDWEKPEPPPPLNARKEALGPPDISKFSSGDSEEHGTEFPPRLYALGPEDQPQTSSLLGKPTEDDPNSDPEATAVTVQSPAAKGRTNQV